MISFTAGKFLALLIYPLSLSLLLCAFALLLRLIGWRRSSLASVTVGILWLYICSTSNFANVLMGHLEHGYVSKAMASVEPVDAIVLLGGAMRGYTHKGTLADLNQQADRLVHAVALYQAGKSPLLLVTGGAAAGDRSEAEQIKDILIVMGVPAQSILLETRSRNTHDNAVYTAQMLADRNLHSILLVTSAFHMRRSQALFEAQGGLQVVPAPTDFQRPVALRGNIVPSWLALPGVSNLSRTTHALHEIIGYEVYRWRGWLE